MKCKYGYEYCEMEAWSICSGCLNDLKEAKKDVTDLNRLLRDVGWGQGEIDTAAVIAEENEQLVAALRKLVEVSKKFDTEPDQPCPFGGCEYCDLHAAIAEAEALLKETNDGP